MGRSSLDHGRFVVAGQEKRLRDAYRDAARAQALIDSADISKPKRNRHAGPHRISEHDVLRSANAGVFAGIAAAPEGVGGLAARVSTTSSASASTAGSAAGSSPSSASVSTAGPSVSDAAAGSGFRSVSTSITVPRLHASHPPLTRLSPASYPPLTRLSLASPPPCPDAAEPHA